MSSTIEDYFTTLFGPAPATAPPPTSRSGCLVCDMHMLRAHRDYAICINCAADITTAGAALDARERRLLRLIEQANDAYHAAYEAMAQPERERWDKFCAARVQVDRRGRWEGSASPETRKAVASMVEAFTRKDSRIPPALLAMYQAGEALYWTNAEVAGHGARITLGREELARCAAALAKEAA